MFGVGNVSPSLHSLNQKHNKNSNIVKYYYIITFLLHLKWLFSLILYILKCYLFLWCKAVFLASFLPFSVSHDPSEIILICWFNVKVTFIIIINVENSCPAYYFLWKHFVSGWFDEQKVQKNSIYLKYVSLLLHLINVIHPDSIKSLIWLILFWTVVYISVTKLVTMHYGILFLCEGFIRCCLQICDKKYGIIYPIFLYAKYFYTY